MTDTADIQLNHLKKAIYRCEVQVWDALVAGDSTADARALSDTFLGVYPDGFADKAAHVGQLDDGATVASYRLNDVRVRPLGTHHALISYHAAFCRQQGGAQERMYVSSIWEKTGEEWTNIFSQDTPEATA
ncbi:nuclear transport factor 2 family protein [Yoonia sp. 208BN28-4]|uniref:nuclear transport factor 2 family protein n=1 Tax=Yoonia sp. 208BN28-4 TaxID=3126505 RepID=UPI0030ADD30F